MEQTWSVVLSNKKIHIFLSQVYCVWQVVKTLTIISNNPVFLLLLLDIHVRWHLSVCIFFCLFLIIIACLFAVTSVFVCTPWFYNTVTSSVPHTDLGGLVFHLSVLLLLLLLLLLLVPLFVSNESAWLTRDVPRYKFY